MNDRLKEAIRTGDMHTLCQILDTGQDIPWVETMEQAIDLRRKDMADTIAKRLFAKYHPDDRIIRKLFRLALVNHLDSTTTYLWSQISDRQNSMNPDDSTALLLAVDTGLTRIAQEIIESGINLNGVNEQNETALHLALKHDMKDIAEVLIRKGAEVTIPNNEGVTPIHMAARFGDISLAKKLLEKGADINARTSSGRTPLQDAVFGDQQAMVKFLLSNSADPNIQDSRGETALHLAYYLNRKPIVKLLQENGANPDIKNNEGKIPSRNIFESRIPKLLKDCFIATVAYDDIDHPDLDILRHFRDHVMVRSSVGRLFICGYYRVGPWLARFIAEIPMLRAITRFGIRKAVRILRTSRSTG